MSSNFLHWEETNDADKIDYQNDRKHGIIEIFCRVRLPYKFYEIANGISILYNLKSFDDYVSELVYEDIEKLLDGTEIVGDCIINKITGEKTDWHSKEEPEESKNEKDYVNVKIDSDLVERLVKVEERKEKQIQQHQQEKEEEEDPNTDENVSDFVKKVHENYYDLKHTDDKVNEDLK